MTFTSHGHHIINTPFDDQPKPTLIARCGGPGLCKECSNETYVAQVALANNTPISQPAVATEPKEDPHMITTQRYARKRFEVDAVQITDDNMEEIADWCLGEVLEERGSKYVKVDVMRVLNERQTKGFVGDWILYAGSGFKVYTTKAFIQSFDKTDDEPKKVLTTSEKLAKVATTVHEPRKKFTEEDIESVPEDAAAPLISRAVESSSHGPAFAEAVPTEAVLSNSLSENEA
jgi:hypothetical protein